MMDVEESFVMNNGVGAEELVLAESELECGMVEMEVVADVRKELGEDEEKDKEKVEAEEKEEEEEEGRGSGPIEDGSQEQEEAEAGTSESEQVDVTENGWESCLGDTKGHLTWRDTAFSFGESVVRVKREVESLPNLSPEMLHGYRIVQDMMSDYNRSSNWPFMEPADLENEDLPDYELVVINPIWLKKIKEKLLANEYESITSLMKDLRLMLENCYRYFGPHHSRTKKGLRMEQILEQKIALLPKEVKGKCSLEATSGVPPEEEAQACLEQQQQQQNRRRSSRVSPSSGGPGANFFSFLLYRVREERSQREKESRKRELDRKRAKRDEREREVIIWEEELLKHPLGRNMRAMWELPQIGHFIFITLKALNISEVPQFELERILLMPQASKTLSMLMTALLSSPNVRAKLDKLPSMPYTVWVRKLTGKVRSWYRLFHKENRDRQKMFELMGLEPLTWDVLGESSPLDQMPFHELLFHQRIWLLKALCDFLLHKHKTIQEAVYDQPLGDQRAYLLGTDRNGHTYLHFPQFCGLDLRIYRQAKWNKYLEESEVEEKKKKDGSRRRKKRKRRPSTSEEAEEDAAAEEDAENDSSAFFWAAMESTGRLTRLQMKRLMKKENGVDSEKKKKKKKKKKRKRRKKDKAEKEGCDSEVKTHFQEKEDSNAQYDTDANQENDEEEEEEEEENVQSVVEDFLDDVLSQVFLQASCDTDSQVSVSPKKEEEQEVTQEIEEERKPHDPDPSQFQLIVENVEDLRQFIDRFREDSRQRPKELDEDEKWRRPRCESELERNLENLLRELEPWETKLQAATKRLRAKLFRENQDFLKRDYSKPDPAEEVWCRTFEAEEEEEAAPQSAAKEVKKEEPSSNSEVEDNKEDEEGDEEAPFRRRLRKRRAKCKRKVIDWEEESNDSSDLFQVSSWSRRKMKRQQAQAQAKEEEARLKKAPLTGAETKKEGQENGEPLKERQGAATNNMAAITRALQMERHQQALLQGKVLIRHNNGASNSAATSMPQAKRTILLPQQGVGRTIQLAGKMANKSSGQPAIFLIRNNGNGQTVLVPASSSAAATTIATRATTTMVVDKQQLQGLQQVSSGSTFLALPKSSQSSPQQSQQLVRQLLQQRQNQKIQQVSTVAAPPNNGLQTKVETSGKQVLYLQTKDSNGNPILVRVIGEKARSAAASVAPAVKPQVAAAAPQQSVLECAMSSAGIGPGDLDDMPAPTRVAAPQLVAAPQMVTALRQVVTAPQVMTTSQVVTAPQMVANLQTVTAPQVVANLQTVTATQVVTTPRVVTNPQVVMATQQQVGTSPQVVTAPRMVTMVTTPQVMATQQQVVTAPHLGKNQLVFLQQGNKSRQLGLLMPNGTVRLLGNAPVAAATNVAAGTNLVAVNNVAAVNNLAVPNSVGQTVAIPQQQLILVTTSVANTNQPANS